MLGRCALSGDYSSSPVGNGHDPSGFTVVLTVGALAEAASFAARASALLMVGRCAVSLDLGAGAVVATGVAAFLAAVFFAAAFLAAVFFVAFLAVAMNCSL